MIGTVAATGSKRSNHSFHISTLPCAYARSPPMSTRSGEVFAIARMMRVAFRSTPMSATKTTRVVSCGAGGTTISWVSPSSV